jgi:hypothetical protein
MGGWVAGMENMRVSRDVEALDLELTGWEKVQTTVKGTKQLNFLVFFF